MTLEQATKVIRDDGAGYVDWALAASEIASSSESKLDDLLICLRRGGPGASPAACILYVRTKRPRKDDSIDSFSMEYRDWHDYLLLHNLIHE
jgi:hypothetical protein